MSGPLNLEAYIPSAADLLLGAAISGDVAEISKLLAENPSLGASIPIAAAARAGHCPAVMLLLARPGALADGSFALEQAARNGHADCVKALLDAAPASANIGTALADAASAGRSECVEILMPRASEDELAEASRKAISQDHAQAAAMLLAGRGRLAIISAMDWASFNGSPKCLEALLPMCRQKSADPRWLRSAAYAGHVECIRILLDAFPRLSTSRLRDLASICRMGRLPASAELPESRVDLHALEKLVPEHGAAQPKLRL